MDPLIVTSIIVIVIVGGFLIGKYSVDGRSAAKKGSSVRPITSKKSEEEAFELALSRIGTYLRENVDRPLSGALNDRRLSLRRAAEDAVAAIADLNFFLADPSGDIDEDERSRVSLSRRLPYANPDGGHPLPNQRECPPGRGGQLRCPHNRSAHLLFETLPNQEEAPRSGGHNCESLTIALHAFILDLAESRGGPKKWRVQR